MQPWIVDARDINDLSIIDQFDKGLLTSSPAIQGYLASATSAATVVSGPKGFGKTLLLKLKRQSLHGRGYNYIPEDQLVDKPIGVPTIMSKKD
jgi:predicted AAA+ superfamily ATPase